MRPGLSLALVVIRNEIPDDIDAITEGTEAAFQFLDISNHTGQFVIEALRFAGVLTLSLVAEVDGHVVGHISFSPVTISDGTQGWYGLGPVPVLPEFQRQGIGETLIHRGLSWLRSMHADGCCLGGYPEYYKMLGFDNMAGFVHEGYNWKSFLHCPLMGVHRRAL
jgi:putative acetyltransferase